MVLFSPSPARKHPAQGLAHQHRMRVVRFVHPYSRLGASDAFAMLPPAGQFVEVPSQVSSAEMPGNSEEKCSNLSGPKQPGLVPTPAGPVRLKLWNPVHTGAAEPLEQP
ncbi:unnamed protein product [Rangifer tarandus platyrhynchus]|uniref:Uncharacterized protein n=1 Tax=Rangifer tarandus platyrhynchus TaxID=3082113 RepID=A0AC59Y8H6_RANTA